MRKKTVKVNDKFQKGYKYELTEPVGRNFHPDFKPELTPKEMLSLGVFGGKYLTDCKNEFPKTWFTRAKPPHQMLKQKMTLMYIFEYFMYSFRLFLKKMYRLYRSV